MRKTNKKGFTIIELVIVITVIAILAGVMIPTFASVIDKAHRSGDKQLAANMNTILTAHADEVEDFDDVVSLLRKNGYSLAALNASAKDCYYVWDKANNRIFIVDADADYAPIYEGTEPSANKADWFVAVSNDAAANEVKGSLTDVNIKQVTVDIDDLMDSIENLNTAKEIYIDEATILTKNKIISITDASANLTLNLGDSTLTTNGTLADKIPLAVENGKLTINGGNIGAMGTTINEHGSFPTAVYACEGELHITGTTFNLSNGNATVIDGGTATIKNVVVNSSVAKYAFNIAGGITEVAAVTITNSTATTANPVFNVCNYTNSHSTTLSTLTVNGGTYTSTGTAKGVVSLCGGDVTINSGKFINENASGAMFTCASNGAPLNKVVIKGGTFVIGNTTYNYNELTEAIVKDVLIHQVLKDAYNIAIDTSNGITITFTKK